MTKGWFAAQMDILCAIFGTAEYSEHRRTLIWNECSDLSEEQFAKIIKHFCYVKNVKYPPLPSDFKESAIKQRQIEFNKTCEMAAQSFNKVTKEQSGEYLKSLLDRLGCKNLDEVIASGKWKELSVE